MLFIFLEISDLFYERMEFKKYKNNYGYLVDDLDDLVMYGSQVSWEISSTIRLVTTRTLLLPCYGYYIKNNTNYSIVKKAVKVNIGGLIHTMDGIY